MESSASSPLSEYDVFVSFRGKDTRRNIVSHLVEALETKMIKTFIDDGELERGEKISSALITAIEGSKISLIIFSKNYGDSRWCLGELVEILHCKQTLNQIVVPVFYKLDSTDVRNQTGKFGTAFNRLANNHESKEIWKKALRDACDLAGWESITFKSEAILVKEIVAYVLQMLKKGSNNDGDSGRLIGTKSRIDKIMGLLRIDESPDDFVVVGIWGMAGAGKTTIAKEVFNGLSGRFNSYCFLENVSEKRKKGLGSIRGNLISNLLNDKTLEKRTPHIGDSSTNQRLRRTKVLVVLDDVDDSSQLEELIGKRGTWKEPFGPGSRVIVTTRDKKVLRARGIADKDVYDMEMLDDKDALELFLDHALGKNQLPDPHPEISEKIVEYVKGIPLVLRELGLTLYGYTQLVYWEGALKKLKKFPPKGISKEFKISYNSLDREVKAIFLDIVCCFKGISNYTVKNVLDSCYISVPLGIDTLIHKSLIYIRPITKSITDMNSKASVDAVEMHDLVQVMGLNIAIRESEKAGSRSRLWRHEDVCDELTRNRGMKNIRCMNFDVSKDIERNLDAISFAEMDSLKFLRIIDSNSSHSDGSKICVSGDIRPLPVGLKYFDWHNCPLDGLSGSNNLVEVRISSGIFKQLWSGRQNLANLKALGLTNCYKLTGIPDLSLAENLEKLDLTGCNCLDITSAIQHLNNLTHLNLSCCIFLKKIPPIEHLKKLTYLNLEYCSSLVKILDLSLAKNLEELDLTGCNGLEHITFSKQHLNKLTHLNLEDCKKLREIPSSIEYLENLTHLNLSSCTFLKDIPSSIKHLKKLTYLNLEYCASLVEIPSSIKHLDSLIHLKLRGCIKITELPNLSKNIKILEVDGNLIKEDRPSIDVLTKLVKLVLWSCTEYEKSPEFLTEIKLLTPSGCKVFIVGGMFGFDEGSAMDVD